MPLFDTSELLGCIKQLVNFDRDWFPNMPNDEPSQLYGRLSHISTDSVMGVRTPASTKLFAILNPTTLRHKNLSVKCRHDVNKNWPLGHGQYTVSGNLGPLVPYVTDAKQNGFDDVLWLLDDFVQEMTILNVFFVIMDRYGVLKLYTPLDNGCIMAGVTRNAILELKDEIEKDTGLKVAEKNVSIHEVIQAYKEERLIEVIGASTSSHIQPINKIVYRDTNMTLNTNKDSKYVSYINNLLTDIMRGPDSHKWVTSLKV